MDLDEYQKLAARTADHTTDMQFRLMYHALGLGGETGEVLEKIKKVIRNDAGVMSDEKRAQIIMEMGDVLWYLSQLAKVLDVPFSEVAHANIKKLADRAERNVIKSEGDTR
jgi:NTP pyrophosphatase (non-canonical NTP hydrolase)